MIRAAILFIQITLLVFISVWLANEPGTVTVVWRDWRIDPPIGVLVLIVALLALITAVSYRFWRFLRQAPTRLLADHRTSKERKGYRELAEGMISLAEGDSAGALKHAQKADSLLKQPAAGHLLIAQAAKLQGKDVVAKEHYEAMLADRHSAVAGIRGLFEQALEDGNDTEALKLAGQIRTMKPDATWVLPHLFELQVAALDWVAADATMLEAIKRRAISGEVGKHSRALVLFERGRLAAEEGEPEVAIGFMREAHDLDPGLPAVAIEYARLLNSTGKRRRAVRVIEQSWSRTKHRDIAHEYVALNSSEASVDQLKAIQKLIPSNVTEGTDRLLLAEYALRAELWGEARRHLEAIFRDGATAAAYELMADLEEQENDDLEAAQRWRHNALTATSDKGWMCDECGHVALDWTVHCANCKAFDGLKWQPTSAPLHANEAIERTSVPLLANSPD